MSHYYKVSPTPLHNQHQRLMILRLEARLKMSVGVGGWKLILESSLVGVIVRHG
jgi:hypothetical protein